MRIRVGDMVKVIAGNDRGVQGKVLKVDRELGKLVVEGVNRVYKHMRRSQRNPQGGRLSKEMPIQLSNVLLVCPSCGAATKIGVKRTADGGKERICKKCHGNAGTLAPPRTKAKAAKS